MKDFNKPNLWEVVKSQRSHGKSDGLRFSASLMVLIPLTGQSMIAKSNYDESLNSLCVYLKTTTYTQLRYAWRIPLLLAVIALECNVIRVSPPLYCYSLDRRREIHLSPRPLPHAKQGCGGSPMTWIYTIPSSISLTI